MSPVQKSAPYVVAVAAVIGSFFAAQASGPEDALSTAAAPQVKTYLRVEGVEGECTDPLHKGCMEVLSYEQGVDVWGDPHVSEGGPGNDFRTLSLTVTRPLSKHTPSLFLKCCQQTRIGNISLEVWREGGPTPQKLMVYTGHDTLMPIIRNMRSLTADGPTEELTFVCGSLERTYTDYDASGQSKGEVHTQWPAR